MKVFVTIRGLGVLSSMCSVLAWQSNPDHHVILEFKHYLDKETLKMEQRCESLVRELRSEVTERKEEDQIK